MKRFFALAALVLGLAACQTEPEGLNVNVGGEQLVTVNVTIPEAETRAGNSDSALGVFSNGVLGTADDNTTMRYILQVYLKSGEQFTQSAERLVEYSDSKSVNFEVRLVPDRDYQFVVWADVVTEGENDADNHYNTADLKNITLKGEWNAMDESRDAFTATELIEDYNGSKDIEIVLKRPFAKLRVVTTDVVNLNNLGITPVAATVEYKTNHRVAFNAFAGEAAGASETKAHSYDIAAYDDNTATEMVLLTDYFFAENDVIQFDFNVYEDAAKSKLIKSNSFVTDINVKRNYLTTIKGNILTDGKGFTVTIDDAFAGEIGTEDGETFANVDTAEEFLEAFNKGVENITLDGNINLNDLLAAGTLSTRAGEEPAFVVAADQKLTIDLNGYTISMTKTQTAAYSLITNNGTLTIVDSKGNGKISYRDEGNGGNYVSNTIQNSGVLTIEGGIIENNSVEIVATNGYPHPIDNSGELVINGGTFTNNANYSSMRIWCNTDDDTEVTINGGTFNGCIDFHNVSAGANKGLLTINGGTFNADTYTNSAVRLLGFGTDVDELFCYINGGTFNGKIARANYTGGEFNSQVFYITGGVFSVDPSEFVDPGYQALDYEPNIYTIQAFDTETRTCVIDSFEQFNNLTALKDNWARFFSNGSGTSYSDYTKVNGGKGADFYYVWQWTIKLNVDIDFNNSTLDAPFDLSLWGCFDGQNHTVKNVTINTTDAAGLFKAGNCSIMNLNLDNVKVTGGNDASVGILASDCHALVDNITVANSSAEGGKYAGGIVGYGYCDVTNCTLTNCSVKGCYKFGGVIGYICASGDGNLGIVDNNTLTDCTVAWTGNYSSGKDTVVMGKVVGNFNCNGSCNGNIVTNMTTTATSLIGKIEAGKSVAGQNSTAVSNNEDLAAALKDSTVTEVALSAGNYTFPTSNLKEGTTITCEQGTVFEGTSSLNINGATIIGAEFKNDSGIAVRGTINGNFKDCTFDGYEALRWCYSSEGETTVFENCVIKTNFRGVHFDTLSGTVIFRNCEINGFNAFGGKGSLIFEECEFGCDQSGYNGLNLYLDTTLEDCDFTYLSGKTNFIDMEAAGKALTIKNCTATLDGAAANIADYVGGSKKGDCTVTIE